MKRKPERREPRTTRTKGEFWAGVERARSKPFVPLDFAWTWSGTSPGPRARSTPAQNSIPSIEFGAEILNRGYRGGIPRRARGRRCRPCVLRLDLKQMISTGRLKLWDPACEYQKAGGLSLAIVPPGSIEAVKRRAALLHFVPPLRVTASQPGGSIACLRPHKPAGLPLTI